MAALSDMLTYLRKRQGLSQLELANQLGMTRSAIGMYETGRREPDLETLEAIADFFNVDMNTLIGKSYTAGDHSGYNQVFDRLTEEEKRLALSSIRDLPPNVTLLRPMKRIPLLGRIACGEPILAEENIEGHIDLPQNIRADYALLCRGDSMVGAGIRDGDVVYIRQQEQVENGQIAAVRVGDDEATLKRFYFDGAGIRLMAENPAFPTMLFVGEEMENVHVIGLAVGYTHALM